jgi:hypothetical protein
MGSPVVLILTHPADVHADAVQPHLDAAGVEVRRVDTAQLGGLVVPVTLHLRGGEVGGDVAGVELGRVVGVWHRRPSEFAVTDPGDAAELRAGAGGVLATLPYLNHPADMAVAGFKPCQLVLAARCGLAVPETMISTVREVGSAMAQRLGGGVVVKPLSRSVAALVDEQDRAGWDRAMHLTQERIQTRRHVRLTVVDGIMYAAQVESPHLDWRRDLDACRYRVVTTPVEVARRVRRLLAVLRLRYAALDFAVDPAGRWWFLEINPNGQFLWIEHETGLSIAAAVATALRLTPPMNAATPMRMTPRGTLPGDADPRHPANERPTWIGSGRRGA